MGPTFAWCDSLVLVKRPDANPSTPATINTMAMILVELIRFPWLTKSMQM
jgi:hypothetical protein